MAEEQEKFPVTILIEHGKPSEVFTRECATCFEFGLEMTGYAMNVVMQSVYRSAIFRGKLTPEDANKLNETINPKVKI